MFECQSECYSVHHAFFRVNQTVLMYNIVVLVYIMDVIVHNILL